MITPVGGRWKVRRRRPDDRTPAEEEAEHDRRVERFVAEWHAQQRAAQRPNDDDPGAG